MFFSRQKFDAVSLPDLGHGAPRLAHAWPSTKLPLLQTQRNTEDSKRSSCLHSEWSHGRRTCPFSTWPGPRDLVTLRPHWNENGVPLNRGQHRKAGDGCRARHNWMVSSLPSSYGFRWQCMWLLYPFSVHVVTFTFHYQLMHLLIKNTFTVHI